MLKQTAKSVIVVAASAVAVPYTIAILFNMIYGWPQRKDKFRRALHPKKVYALNYVVLQEMAKIRYLGLLLRWTYFYTTSTPERLVKDLPYGTRDNKLDVYLPQQEQNRQQSGSRPVVIFMYGGSWGSGDKNMYGLLCSHLADHLKAVVCCPNYSSYPKGYVDDMVQDVVDCISWIQGNIDGFNGDKNRIMLIGHSAGGHLCMLSVLELTLKRLLYHPESVLYPYSGAASLSVSRQSSIFSDSIRFEDKHFNGSSASSNDNNGDGSFYVVDEKYNEKSFIVLESEKSGASEDNVEETEEEKLKVDEDGDHDDGGGGGDGRVSEEEDQEEEEVGDVAGASGDQKKEVKFEVEKVVVQGDGDGRKTEEVLRVELTETDGADGSQQGEGQPQIVVEPSLSQTQTDVQDMLSSIKLVIGLAGVYHIAEHFEHESSRGIEDISTMAKAMYGPEHFDRLSPTEIVPQLPDKIRLPPILLVHGDIDKTVPLSSSKKFGQALWDKGCYDVSMSILPGCSHTDICLDLMDPSRKWHAPVMGEIMKAAQKCL